jgi:hypothetical protein
MTATLVELGVAYARANWGRWVADCSRPFCLNAHKVAPGVGGMICDECGHATEIRWPADTALIEELLLARPEPHTRNWHPGETALDLMFENVAHGIAHSTTPELGAAASRLVLDTAGDGDPVVRLLDEPLVIDAHPSLAIGA